MPRARQKNISDRGIETRKYLRREGQAQLMLMSSSSFTSKQQTFIAERFGIPMTNKTSQLMRTKLLVKIIKYIEALQITDSC